jgi:hypothetical protein
VRRYTRTTPACCGSLQKRCCRWSWREGGYDRNRCAGLLFYNDYAIEYLACAHAAVRTGILP